ncbi:MAG: hypothetical protein LBI14_04595 [Treponema sp.]|jgi:hypothetical protein|nr:hypothetical protein [Treponema sp.]
MVVRDEEINRLVERISAHYNANISNRFIRPALLQLPLEKQVWDSIERLTGFGEHFQYQGFLLDELYLQLVAAGRFVSVTRRDLVPSLRQRLSSDRSGGSDRVLRDMAVNNFASNIQLFADLVHEIFIKLVEIDKANSKGKKPAYQSIPELQDLGRLLVGS